MADFNLTELATKLHFPGNTVQLDNAGLPSIMVYIPKFKNSDVLAGGDDSTHPAFIVNGQEIEGFLYSKYENVVHEGRCYSLPGEDPVAMTSHDAAAALCEEKGAGWHLSTAAEWAAVALWCKKNGFMPAGNNYHGRDVAETEVKAVPANYNTDGQVERTMTGTGPVTWAHDGTASGIMDLNGNIWEWQGGIRLVWGELQILANNDAAHPDNPQNVTSTLWRAINAADGSLVDPECDVNAAPVTSGNTIRLNYVDGSWVWGVEITDASTESRAGDFGLTTATAAVSDAAKLRLRTLALLPEDGATSATYGNDCFYASNGTAERCICRGGTHATGTSAGVFCLYAGWDRTVAAQNVGFRASYIPEIATQTP